MSRRPFPALFVLLAAACTPQAPAGPAGDTATVEAEVRAASASLLDALNAHDADAILSHYALTDAFTSVACVDVRVGGQGFANLTRALHAQFEDAEYAMDVRSVQVLGPDAAVVSLQGTMLSPLFVTRVFRRQEDGAWRVTWEHESWPDCPAPPAPHPGTGPEAVGGEP